MTIFRVWAPRASGVDLVSGDARRPMAVTDGGWFELDLPELGPGRDYAFSLDGGPPRPDPRSRWQPNGVHGPARVVDLESFAWTDDEWRGIDLAAAVIYELHVGTFSAEGTFAGVISHLDHLVALGVDAIELMPVAEFPGDRGWGYDGVDLFAPHHAYGGPDGLQRLIDACHGRGLAVILDVVYNHLGPDGNFIGEFGPYFTGKYTTPWGQAVNFDDAESDEVRTFFVDNAIHWLREYHIDGLRLDAVHAIIDTSAVHILEEINSAVDALAGETGRRYFVIAESDLNDPRMVRQPEEGGYGLTAQWSDDFHHALHAVLTGERAGYYRDFGSMAQLAKSLRQAFVYDGEYSASRRRRHGRRPTGVPARRFVGYLQNHDQIGNRAAGERSSQLLDVDRLMVGAALVLTAPFVPMLFQGEEWAASTPFQYFTDHRDAALARAVSAGRRHEFAAFGWSPDDVPDPQDLTTFVRSRLQWAERLEGDHRRLLDWHKHLLALRRSEPALSSGSFEDLEVVYDGNSGWLLLRRGDAYVAANFGTTPAAVPLATTKKVHILASSSMASNVGSDFLEMAPASVLVFRV